MKDYQYITDEEFDELLLQCMQEDGMESVFLIPGVYECVSEHYNNQILERYEEGE